MEEVRRLLSDESFETAWLGAVSHFSPYMLAASTRPRMGEVQGPQVRHFHADHIAIAYAWERKNGLKEPKGNSAREVPIPSRTSAYLSRLIDESPYKAPESLGFHGTDGQTPIGHEEVLDAFYAVLSAIGVSGEERKQRNVTFHSWRHLFNSLCRSRIPDYEPHLLTGFERSERRNTVLI